MDNGKNKLIDIFSKERFYKIPSYQRSYAWEDKQLKDFYEDFKNDYHKNNYYYGTILLQGNENNEDVFDIVDGQQRITTLVIFIYCLLKEIRIRKEQDKENSIWNDDDIDDWNDLEKKFIRFKGQNKLMLQTQENGFFDTSIIKDEDILEETPAQKKLKNAKIKFQNWLKSTSNKNIDKFIENINKAEALVYIIKDIKEASLIFETTNDRGKNLTNLEKIKSYLMYKVSLTKENPDQLLSKIEDTFNKIYRDYEKIENRQISEDSILMYNFIANEQWNNKGGKQYQHYIDELKNIIEDLIANENITIDENEDAENEKEDYKKLREYIEKYLINLEFSYANLENIILHPQKEFLDLLALGRMASFYPLLLKAYKTDITEDKTFFRKLCGMCENFVFRNLVVLHYTANKYQTKFYELARDFGNEEDKNIKSIVNQFEKLYKKIAQLTLSLGSDEKFLEELGDNDFYNKYKTSERNYFYWKYENWLRNKDGCSYTPLSHQDLNNKDSKLKLSIEHIVAQSNEEQKENIIKETQIINISDKSEFDKKYLNSIGNLTIDPVSSNSSKGKKPVDEKNSKYFTKAPYMSQNELENFLIKCNGKGRWTVKSIINRREAILSFAKECWCEPLKNFNISMKEIQELRKQITNEDYYDSTIEEME